MKILYLLHQFYPEHFAGTEKFVLQLAQQCQLAGHQVTVVTYRSQQISAHGQAKPARRMLFRRLRAYIARGGRKLGRHTDYLQRLVTRLPNPITQHTYTYANVPVIAFTHRHKFPLLAQQLSDNSLTAYAQNLLENERPDLIHAAHLGRVAEFLNVAQTLNIPYLLTLTDYWMLCPRSLLINQNQQLCTGPRGGAECRHACLSVDQTMFQQRYAEAKRLLKHARAVIAPSRFLAKLYQSEFGFLSIHHIPYGIMLPQIQAKRRCSPTLQPLTFLFAGRLQREKGVELLLTAFRQLSARHIRLEIYGAGTLQPMVQQAAAEDKRIDWGGVLTIEQIGERLNQVDVVVVPSIWHENLPLIMQEAQACGVPTLVSDVGGMTECVTDGVNGFTFRVGDGADLQHKMQMIIDQPEILNTIKENMCNPKAGQYRVTSLEEEARLYLKEYTKILGQ